MTLWIVWSVFVTALVAVAALAAERVASAYGVARRGVWIAASLASTIGLAMMGFRTKQTAAEWAAAASTSASQLGSGRIVNGLPTAGEGSALSRVERSLDARSLAKRTDEWIGAVWAAMSLACLAGLAISVVRLRRRRESWVETMTDAGSILVARDVGPAVVGVLAPRVVLPEWALDCDGDTRRLMLRHEVEHLRAGDSRVLFGAAMLVALLPWNAALWFLCRRLRLAIEIDCDARVIQSVGSARNYGLMLLSVSDRYTTPIPASALLFERGAQLEARITAMTTPSQKRPFLIAAVGAAVIGLVLATAAWTPRPIPFRSATTSAQLRIGSGPGLLPGNPSPRYPDDMRAAGVEGVVVATFVTDERGVPDSTSLSIVQATNESFAAAVRTVAPRLHYSGKGPVLFVCRFNITPADHPRDSSYVSPRYVAGVDTTHQIIITGVQPRTRSSLTSSAAIKR